MLCWRFNYLKKLCELTRIASLQVCAIHPVDAVKYTISIVATEYYSTLM